MAHFLAIDNGHGGAVLLGIFDTFEAARVHLERETDKDTATSQLAAVAWIEEWDGANKTAEYARARNNPKRWEKTNVEA